MKILMVFDFDHTVVDDNSDTWVIRCLPNRTLPNSVKSSYRKGHWTEFMGRVLKHIGEQEVSPDGVRSVMETIPYTAGMADLLTFISEHKDRVDCIVVSDSNTLFIDWILQAAGLRGAVDHIFTNPAHFNDHGHMEVSGHHSHDCQRCPVNLCKRKVLEQYLSQRAGGGSSGGVSYRCVVYVGDGGNDLCPALCLRAQDVVMPRVGYSLEKLLRVEEGVRARVSAWSSGEQILQELKASMES
ncbi:pyridoxal phosphate phosphatase PHOSPHO2 [Salarias fasciatus]|nr:pyridoxal phosphate phosphatase PHOSPHO2 [Salarias fasciatus]